MHIGFDAKRLFFNRSGLGSYSRSTVGLLSRYAPENSYTLFSPKEGNSCGFRVPENMNVVVPDGIASTFSSVWRSCWMGGAINKSGAEIFHGLSNELPADIRSSGARSVVTMHDVIFIRRPELYKPTDRYLYTKKYGKSCRNADRIIAISRCTAEDLMDVWDIPEQKIDVVYQGCDPVFGADISDEKLTHVRAKYKLPGEYLLSVGTIEERKNLMLTVRAMAECGMEGELVACGRRTPYADEVMEYARQRKVDHRVHLIHNATTDDLPAIYRMASVFVYPSFYEGFGIPILEAFNAGVPVITTRGGVFVETGGDAALYVDPNSEEEMAAALARVMGEREQRGEMVRRGYLHAARFSEPAIAENLMSVYRKLL